MPENDPPNDPFADLFGRLPDPRTGARRPSGDAADPATPRAADPGPAGSAPDAAGPAEPGPAASGPTGDGTEALPSRRAAREARRAQTGPTPTPEGAASARPAAGSPAAAAPPAATSPAPTSPSAASPAAAASRPGPTPAPGQPATSPAARAESPAAASAQPPVRRPATPPTETVSPSTAPAAASSTSAAAAPAPATAVQREPALVGGSVAASGASSPARSAASGSLEDLFAGRAHTDEVGAPAARPPKKRRRVGGWIALAIVLLIIGGLVGGGFVVWNTYGERVQAFFGVGQSPDYDPGMATGEARVTVVSGDTGESVSAKLFDAGVTKTSDALYKYMVKNTVGFTFQPGVYKLQQQMTSEAVIAALRDPANRLDYSVQLREGLTVAQSLDIISEQLTIPRADLDAATKDPSVYGVSASSLEGWIFPATYDFDEGVTATDVIKRMVARTVQSLETAGVPEADRERILTIASIIQREARESADFYKVSRVIENRLQPDNDETHGLLQMDSTAQYGVNELGAGASSSTENALTSDNPWNTYVHPGLPVGPIANPGDLAIDAAMHPVDGPWYYFTTVNLATGETVFSTNYADQEAAAAQFRAWCKENPNGGC